MPRFHASFTLALFLFMPTHSFADEVTSFKGIKFGMKADEIAKLGGGNTKLGCRSAINSVSVLKDDVINPWTFGGIDVWEATCAEDQSESARVPDTSGMYQLGSLLYSHNNRLASLVGKKTYSVDDLVEIFSEVFGDFEIETKVLKNGLGQEFIKKEATAMHGGAVIRIADVTTGSNHEEYIRFEIVSLDYLSKKGDWERKQNSQKIKDARSDF